MSEFGPLSRIAYVNGSYLPHNAAAVHIEDRGYQFSDGVYEVIAIHRGSLVDEAAHMERLERSLSELEIDWPMSARCLSIVMRQVIGRNRINDGIIYLQISRGVAPRNHAFPAYSESSLILTARSMPPFDAAQASKGVDVITIPEIRWKRRDIKSISLLANCLGKEQAVQAGAYEAWFVDDDGLITEGTSSNAWIVAADGTLMTRHADNAILNGITRKTVLQIADEQGIDFVEKAFSVEDAKAAAEAFITSTTSFVKPVARIDGDKVSGGKPGPLVARLLDYYAEHMNDQAAV